MKRTIRSRVYGILRVVQNDSKIRMNSFSAGPAQQHLVLNAAQERLVAEIARVEVGGEDHERLEGRGHLAAGHEAEIVDAALHGNDPAVQDLRRSRDLAAEVVDEVDAVVGLYLEGSFVDLGRVVEAQVQHVHGQLAAGDDEGPFALQPAAVEVPLHRHHGRGRFLFDALVVDGVVHLDDVALALDGIGQVDGRRIEVVQRFDEEGLAVARAAVHQHGRGGGNRRADLREHPLRDDHAAERLGQRLFGEPSFAWALLADHIRILGEGHRGRAVVLVGFEVFARPRAARLGQCEDRGHVAHSERPLHLQEVLQLQRFHDVLNHAELQTDGGGELLAVQIAPEVQDLQDQLFDRRFREAGLFQGFRFVRRRYLRQVRTHLPVHFSSSGADNHRYLWLVELVFLVDGGLFADRRRRCCTKGMTAAVLLAGLAFYPVGVQHHWGLADIENLPALAVATVDQVVKLGPVYSQAAMWPQHFYEARVTVHRAFFQGADRGFDNGSRITVQYVNDDPCTGGCGGGGGMNEPPNFVPLHPGEVALFPLRQRKGLWLLGGIGKINTVLPAYRAEPAFGSEPRTGRAFLLRELTNALTHGTAAERFHAAAFFLTPSEGIPPELPPLIRAALGRNDDQWLETGCAFLGGLGVPGNVPELVYGEASPPFHKHLREMITWILWKGDRRDSEPAHPPTAAQLSRLRLGGGQYAGRF